MEKDHSFRKSNSISEFANNWTVRSEIDMRRQDKEELEKAGGLARILIRKENLLEIVSGQSFNLEKDLYSVTVLSQELDQAYSDFMNS